MTDITFDEDVDDLVRFTLPDGRVYTDNEDLYLPSVSTVLDQKPEPEGITKWQQNNDGTGGTTHWRDILSYKSSRGTLIHYNLLNEFADEDMYSVEESDSEEELKDSNEWDRYQDDLAYAENAWDRITQFRGITEESVLNVECFVINSSIGYAGQFDLLYVDKNDNIVLSDIKTSKQSRAPYKKHKLQLVAYMNALNLEVDTLEVLVIHPDSEKWKISHDSDWDESVDELWSEFVELREEMGDVEDRMKKIANNGINDAQDMESPDQRHG